MAQRTKMNPAVDELERALENALEFAFHPVGPRPEYLDHLRQRLMHAPDDAGEDESLLNAILAAVGLISALVLILACAKLVQNLRKGFW